VLAIGVRDPMIALPGRRLATDDTDVRAWDMIALRSSGDRGSCPTFSDCRGDAGITNTVGRDSWCFEQSEHSPRIGRDYDLIRTKLYGLLADIIAWHESAVSGMESAWMTNASC